MKTQSYKPRKFISFKVIPIMKTLVIPISIALLAVLIDAQKKSKREECDPIDDPGCKEVEKRQDGDECDDPCGCPPKLPCLSNAQIIREKRQKKSKWEVV